MSKRKNVSKTIPNGTLVHTHDDKLYGADGQSTKSRMAVVVDSNDKDEVAIVKYTTSERNGTPFENDKGFKRFGNQIYTRDIYGNPLIISQNGTLIKNANNKRDITPKQANEIKRANLQDSKYKTRNHRKLKELKNRGKNT